MLEKRTLSVPTEEADPVQEERRPYGWLLGLIFALFGFLLGLELIADGFRLLNEGAARDILRAAHNPFVALFIGLLATAILQSSSTVTAAIVAAVAVKALALDEALPMVMGANIGTTLTSSIVSIGHITRRHEFERAFGAATLHDLFNLATTALLFPLEYWFGMLSRVSSEAAHALSALPETPGLRWLPVAALAPCRWVAELLSGWFSSLPLLVVLMGFLLLFSGLQQLVVTMRKLMIGEPRRRFEAYFFGGRYRALGWGFLLTAAVQSSSVMTSLVVPLVGTGRIPLRKSFTFIVGVNVGTTLTAVLAALYRSEAALSIAVAHVLFNVIGAVFFTLVPGARTLAVWLGGQLGAQAARHRVVGFLYLIAVFFLIPFLLIYFGRDATPHP